MRVNSLQHNKILLMESTFGSDLHCAQLRLERSFALSLMILGQRTRKDDLQVASRTFVTEREDVRPSADWTVHATVPRDRTDMPVAAVVAEPDPPRVAEGSRL
jgi:hypothetical protein